MTRLGSAMFVAAIGGLLLAACASDSTPSSDDALSIPSTAAEESMPRSATVPQGFTTIQAQITAADGEVCEVCLWLADDSDERARGLMGVNDLGDAVGMAFRFDEALIGSFYMFQTPTPLSIAWFGADGAIVGTADMDPCLDTPAGECRRYSPDREYDLAIEVFEGGLEPLGLGSGSRVELIDGSEADRCPVP